MSEGTAPSTSRARRSARASSTRAAQSDRQELLDAVAAVDCVIAQPIARLDRHVRPAGKGEHLAYAAGVCPAHLAERRDRLFDVGIAQVAAVLAALSDHVTADELTDQLLQTLMGATGHGSYDCLPRGRSTSAHPS